MSSFFVVFQFSRNCEKVLETDLKETTSLEEISYRNNLPRDNSAGGNLENCWGPIFQGGNFQREIFWGTFISGTIIPGIIFREAIFQGEYIGGSNPGGNFPGDNFPWRNLLGGNLLGCNFTEGNFPVIKSSIL